MQVHTFSNPNHGLGARSSVLTVNTIHAISKRPTISPATAISAKNAPATVSATAKIENNHRALGFQYNWAVSPKKKFVSELTPPRYWCDILPPINSAKIKELRVKTSKSKLLLIIFYKRRILSQNMVNFITIG